MCMIVEWIKTPFPRWGKGHKDDDDVVVDDDDDDDDDVNVNADDDDDNEFYQQILCSTLSCYDNLNIRASGLGLFSSPNDIFIWSFCCSSWEKGTLETT